MEKEEGQSCREENTSIPWYVFVMFGGSQAIGSSPTAFCCVYFLKVGFFEISLVADLISPRSEVRFFARLEVHQRFSSRDQI